MIFRSEFVQKTKFLISSISYNLKDNTRNGWLLIFFNQNMTFQMFTVLRKKLINVFLLLLDRLLGT